MSAVLSLVPPLPRPAPKVAIGGGPRVGKSHLAARIGGDHGIILRATDDLIGQFSWSDASAEVARWFDEPGGAVVEGTAVVRAIRKWLADHPDGLPADYFLWLTVPRVPLTKQQNALLKGCNTVWSEVEPELRRRGAKIFTDTEGGPL